MSGYQEIIAKILARRGIVGVDPRHIEGYMRLGHSTLSGLTIEEFEQEIMIGLLREELELREGVADL